jgi:cytochrome c oxidase subunit 3
MSENIDPKLEIKKARQKAALPLLWIGLVSIVMLFAGLTSAYIVTQADDFWVSFDLPQMFFVSTGLILLSSIAIAWALRAAKSNNFMMVKIGILLTLLLGIGFSFGQYMGWKELIHEGYHPNGSGNIGSLKGQYGEDYVIKYNGQELVHRNGVFFMPGDTEMKESIDPSMFQTFNSASSFLYVLSGLHVLHLLGGIIALVVVLANAGKNKYNSENHLGLKICATYWHFLDGLWVYLFLFLYFIN